MFLLEEIGVESAMIVAIVVVAAIFVWATATMLVRWRRFARSERLSAGEPATDRVAAAIRPSRVAGPSL
jgi:hypothetical protein